MSIVGKLLLRLIVVIQCLLPLSIFAAEELSRAALRAEKRAVLSAQQDGRILSFPVDSNQKFNAGDVLVEMDCSLQIAQLEATQAEYEAAVLKRDNLEQLSHLSSISQLELQLSRTDVRIAQSRMDMARELGNRCKVIASYDGTVVRRLASPQEHVTPGQPIIEIIGDDPLEVVVIAPQAVLQFLKRGTKFDFVGAGSGVRAQGSLQELPVVVDTASQTVEIIGRLDDVHPLLQPGLTGTIVLHDE